MWYNVLDRANADGADVFYIPSTWEFDWTTPDSVICHYADITNQEHLDDMSIEMRKASEYMADGNRFYSPFYRHITLDTWATLNNDTINARYFNVAFKDICAAFNYYLEHNPKILLHTFSNYSEYNPQLIYSPY